MKKSPFSVKYYKKGAHSGKSVSFFLLDVVEILTV